MRSLFRTWRHGRSQTIAFEDYQWTDGLLGSKTGIKRVETNHLVRFERLSFQETDHGFRYYRTSDWFINFPFCHNDTQIWVANAAITFLTLLLLGKLLVALLRAVFKQIF